MTELERIVDFVRALRSRATDRDEWPRKLYDKLGFDEMDVVYEFIRPSTK